MPSIHRQRILQTSKMHFELLRHLALGIRHDRAYKRVVVVHESISLPGLGDTLALLDQEGLVFLPQPTQTARNGLVVTSFAAQRQNAV